MAARTFLAFLAWLLATSLQAEPFQACRVLAAQGEIQLTRFENETWPLEVGQTLPGDIQFGLSDGASLTLSILERVDVTVLGPASLKILVLESASEPIVRQTLLQLSSGQAAVDLRPLTGRTLPADIDLPDARMDLAPGISYLVQTDPEQPSRLALWSQGQVLPAQWHEGSLQALSPSPKAQDWDLRLIQALQRPIPVLIVARDYDAELKDWPKPPYLGPALYQSLSSLKGLSLVAGSGDRTLAVKANHALKSGFDDYLRQLGREKGARWVVAGNLVVDLMNHQTPWFEKHPQMSAHAEYKVVESFAAGETLLADTANTLVARRERPLYIARKEALQAASSKAAAYLSDGMINLLEGKAHESSLRRLVFSGVDDVAWAELRRALNQMDSVRRYFKRRYAQRVLNLDLVLRKPLPEFLDQLQSWPWLGFSLSVETGVSDADLKFTLRAKLLKSQKAFKSRGPSP